MKGDDSLEGDSATSMAPCIAKVVLIAHPKMETFRPSNPGGDWNSPLAFLRLPLLGHIKTRSYDSSKPR